MEFQKKNKKPITYANKGVFISSFMFNKETYISIDNTGMHFISINSSKEMTIDEFKNNASNVEVLCIPNIDDIYKRMYIGKVLEHNGRDIKITKLRAVFENNEIVLKMSHHFVDK